MILATTDLLTQKNDFWFRLMNFNFYELLLDKDQYVHLSRAKQICPNSWVLESSVFESSVLESSVFD